MKAYLKAARRTAERRNLLHTEECRSGSKSGGSTTTRYGHTRRWIPTAGTRGNRLAGKPGSANVSAKLTLQTDYLQWGPVNTCRDEAILDSGGRRFVREKGPEFPRHAWNVAGGREASVKVKKGALLRAGRVMAGG